MVCPPYVRTVTFISGHRAFSGLQSCLLVFPPKPKRGLFLYTTAFSHLRTTSTLTISLPSPFLLCGSPGFTATTAFYKNNINNHHALLYFTSVPPPPQPVLVFASI